MQQLKQNKWKNKKKLKQNNKKLKQNNYKNYSKINAKIKTKEA